MHSDSESTLISPRADKFGSTLPPLDKRAQDKNEGGEEGPVPSPLFKRNPEDNEGEDWRKFSDSATLAKISAIKKKAKKRKQARAAQAISSSVHLGGAKPKQINPTKEEAERMNLEAAREFQRIENEGFFQEKAALEKAKLTPKGDKDGEETMLLTLGQFSTQQDKSESDKFTTAVMNKEEQDSLLDNWSEDWTFTSDATQPTPRGQESPGHIDLDYSSDKCEAGLDNALGDEEDKYTKADNICFDEQKDKTSIPQAIISAPKKPVLTQQGIIDLIESQATRKEQLQMLDGIRGSRSTVKCWMGTKVQRVERYKLTLVLPR